MIYLRAGLYAEGPTDYYFLTPLLERLLWEVGMNVLSEPPEVAEPLALDAPAGIPRGREHAIPAAIAASWDECTLYVIHSDGAGDPEASRRSCCEPAIAAARARFPDVLIVPCVPVRETEAWLLADDTVFQKLRRARIELKLPREPESEPDPKRSLRHLLTDIGMRRMEDVYGFFGSNIATAVLRRLPAFQRFETDLSEAVRSLGRRL